MTVKLEMEVTRGADERLIGTVSAEERRVAFDGTLELMRVFEELVPRATDGDAGGSGASS